MVVANLLMWAASAIAAVWKTSQLARAPRDNGLRVVTICTLLVFVALTAQLAATAPGTSDIFPSQSPKLVQNVILTFFFAMLIVLLQSSADRSKLRSRGYIEIVVALLTSGGLTIAFVAAAALGGASYGDALASSDSALLAFYLLGNAYMSYATARGAYLAWIMAQHTRSRARLSLRVAAIGLVVCCAGTHIPRVLATSSRLVLDTDLLAGTAVWTPRLLAVGIVAFFIGIGYPGLRTGLIKARLWREGRRRYRQLRPLWKALYDQFPTIALFPPASPAREALQVRHMRLRYYRRAIECRDGLVCLSSSLNEPIDGSQSHERQAELVRDALTHRSPDTERSMPSIIASPASPGIDADTLELLALARAFDRITRRKTRPTTDDSHRAAV